MSDIREIICTAVDTIVSKKLEGLEYDITKLCTIVDDSSRSKGLYVVSDGTARFEAYSTDTTFREGNSVLVVIPNGDYNMQKTISGRIAATNTEPFNYTSPMDTMVKITSNIFDADDAIVQSGSLLANDITIKNNEEIPGTAIGPLYSIKDASGLTGFDRLGITADFRTWLNGLDVVSGTYGLKIYIYTDAAVENGETKTLCYDLTFNNDNMYGNPYQFEDYFSQEKVFDISNINRINQIDVYFYQSGNFKDGNGNLIPYTDTVEDETIKLPNNLFVDNVAIYLGYDIGSFTGETLMLCTENLLTYRYKEHINENGAIIIGDPDPVTMNLRWIHKVNDLEYELLTQEQINTDQYKLKWYHYNPKTSIIDQYAGANWEPLESAISNKMQEELTAIHAENYASIEEYYKEIERIQSQYQEQIQNLQENLNIQYTLSKDKQTEEFKVIGIIKQDPTIILNEDGTIKEEIENEGLVYYSNVLIFTNEEYVTDFSAEATTALSIVFHDETRGNYFLYDQNGKIINEGLGQGFIRSMEVMYHGAKLVNNDNMIIEYIIWYLPFEKSSTKFFADDHTMFVANEDFYSENDGHYKNDLTKQWLYTLSKNGTDYVGTKRTFGKSINDIITTQSFAIKNHWAQSNANNTVRCIVNINGVDYEAATELRFGKAGSQGTNRTLVLEYQSNENALVAGSDTAAAVEAILYDLDGTRLIPSGTFTWSWVTSTSYISRQDNGNITQLICETDTVPNDNYSILKCTYEEEGSITLIAYLPIAIKAEGYSHIEGAREVIYNHQGVPSYYTDAYILYKLEENELKVPEYTSVNVNWSIKDGENATNNVVQSYIPVLKDIEKAGVKYKALSAAPFYLKDYADKVCVSCSSDNTILWSQPILIMQSQYDFAMLNKWDGSLTINEENGTILSTMLGAGRKNDDNTFSGVLIGDVKEGTGLYEAETLTGVYGIHEGISSFALRENGTATFGKAGLGQIHIDGNESTIKSSSRNANDGTGMLINLNEGIIDIKESENDTARLTLTSKYNTVLINVDNSNYYLQSDNYTDSDGMKIDLSNGKIQTAGDNGKVIIKPNSPYLQIQGLDSKEKFKNLMYVGNDSYYLQSADYAENTSITNGTGIKIDLMDGKITGYNLYLAGYNEDGKSIVIDSGATYPLKIGSYFYVDYDGVLNCSGATIQNANIVNAHIENLTGDDGRDVTIGNNFYVSPSGHMSASGASINGTVSAGGLRAGSLLMKDNQILFDNGGYIIEADSGGLLIGMECFSPKGEFVDLSVTNSVTLPSASSIMLGDGNSLYEYVQALIDIALANFEIPYHEHDVSVSSNTNTFKHGGHGVLGTSDALSGTFSMSGRTGDMSQGYS